MNVRVHPVSMETVQMLSTTLPAIVVRDLPAFIVKKVFSKCLSQEPKGPFK